MTELTPRETSRLTELETIVRGGLSTFYEVGEALAEINDSRLYRELFATFDLYCRGRWNMGRKRAYQLMAAARMREELSTTVDMLPESERQVRELSRVAPDDRAPLWSAAVEMAGGKQPTALLIEEAREALPSSARQELLDADDRELRHLGETIAEADGDAKRAKDMDRMLDRIRQARKIAERYGSEDRRLLPLASGLKRWEEKAEGLV